ncbi:MAG: hypothetical protein LKF37_10130, partial [Lentilactobacillus diolivorans]|nr:hypothetical protein [Lentilactobacillus diolivorans]
MAECARSVHTFYFLPFSSTNKKIGTSLNVDLTGFLFFNHTVFQANMPLAGVEPVLPEGNSTLNAARLP